MFFLNLKKVYKHKINIILIMKEGEIFDIEKSGFSLLIDDDINKILFDTGTKKEVSKIKKTNYDFIVLSHGHKDHVEGLNYLDTTKVICHPDALNKKTIGSKNIGMNLSKGKNYEFVLKKEIYEINKNTFFLGEISRDYEKVVPVENDFLLDDSGLVVKTSKGLVVILGCSHSGLRNITEFVKSKFKEPIYAIVGGFHLLKKDNSKDIDYLIKNYKEIYPMHCMNESAISYFKKNKIKLTKTNQLIEI